MVSFRSFLHMRSAIEKRLGPVYIRVVRRDQASQHPIGCRLLHSNYMDFKYVFFERTWMKIILKTRRPKTKFIIFVFI